MFKILNFLFLKSNVKVLFIMKLFTHITTFFKMFLFFLDHIIINFKHVQKNNMFFNVSHCVNLIKK